MNKTILLSLGAAALATLAGCVETAGPVTPGRATMAEVEQACVNRLARESFVQPNQVSVANSTGSSEGSAVFLINADGGNWTCRADGAGNITAMEFNGGNL
jgi:hypothetical protein